MLLHRGDELLEGSWFVGELVEAFGAVDVLFGVGDVTGWFLAQCIWDHAAIGCVR